MNNPHLICPVCTKKIEKNSSRWVRKGTLVRMGFKIPERHSTGAKNCLVHAYCFYKVSIKRWKR